MLQMTCTLVRLLLLASLLVACSDSSPNAERGIDDLPVLDNNYQETGDLNSLEDRGKLRILVTRRNSPALPRQGSPIYMEQTLAARFADQLELQPVLVYVDGFDALIPALRAGQGDLIAANLTITDERKQLIDFTVPIGHAHQQLITRVDASIKKPADLKKQRIGVQAEKTYQATAKQLVKRRGASLLELGGDLDTDQILDQLKSGAFDATILDSNLVRELQQYRQDFHVAFDVSNEQPLAWGIRQNSPELLEALNRFINQQQLNRTIEPVYLTDLDGIKQRKTLRVLTRNNAACYFLWRGELLGFEYELTRSFAKKHGLRVEMITGDSHEDLITQLKEGKADMIAAFMTVTEQRKQQGIAFSRPYHYASEILVTRAGDDSLAQPEDLKGRSVHVRRSSAYWQTLSKLRDQGIDFKLVEVPESVETEELIAQVADKRIDLTVADSHILDTELTWRDDIKAAFALTEPLAHAWVVRSENKQLLNEINRFLKREYRGLFYNITYEKYFENPHTIQSHREQRVDLNPDGSISPYDELAKKYARQYGFDWRLLVAQMYQESRFDPQAKSWVGARGLMQVMPRTAKELGLKDLTDPDIGIHAGVRYLDWVRDRFEPELDVRERMWFTLAAYNAGQGHVKDARRLARQQGLNPDKWFNNVEKAMLLLSKKEFARRARHGYVRGREPVNYVRDIRNRFLAYQRLARETI
jgi:membrane-bound lytic murein transglycosylase F